MKDEERKGVSCIIYQHENAYSPRGFSVGASVWGRIH